MTLKTTSHLTPTEYLALERAAERKSEYRDGEMVEMPGVTGRHSLIVTNFVFLLGSQLRNADYDIHAVEFRLWVPKANLYTYPDIMVIPGSPPPPPQGKGYNDIGTDPILIVEVLSPSTESYDRGLKFKYYRAIPALQEYLLVSQHQPRIEMHRREPDQDLWQYSSAEGLDAAITLPSIACQLDLIEVYRRVNFDLQPT